MAIPLDARRIGINYTKSTEIRAIPRDWRDLSKLHRARPRHVLPVRLAQQPDILKPSCSLDFIPPEPRWGASGASSVAAGGISYIIIQKVAAKALGKSVFRLGAKALTGKVAGAGGAMAGDSGLTTP